MSVVTSPPAGSGTRREFLNSLPSNFRSRAANLFLDPIRASLRTGKAITPAEAVRAVRSEVARRLKSWRLNADQKAGLEALRGSLSLDCARDYAAYLLRLEVLPRDERNAVKKQQDATGTANVPPTAAQIRYLRLLHYKDEAPETLGEAIALIDRIKKGNSSHAE